MKINHVVSVDYNQQKNLSFRAIGFRDFMDYPPACDAFIRIVEKYPNLVEIGFYKKIYELIAIIKTKAGSELEQSINQEFFGGKAKSLNDDIADGLIKARTAEFKYQTPVAELVESAKRSLEYFNESKKDPVNRIIDMALGITPYDFKTFENFFLD